MPPAKPLKPGNLKDPEVAELFSTKDPEHRYEDLREIGHGAFGAVFYALDKETKEPVAIKKMNFTGRQSVDKWNDIIREVRFLRSINNPYIVRYKASFLKEHTCWLIMEYCVGSAADILKVYKKPFMEIEIAEICAQTLQGIAYLHSLKRIHRDIKAGNILLTDAGQVKLADLGSASLSSPAQTFVGSPYWMAPEVILAQDSGLYDERADIWSFGITCIELAELKPPFLDMNAYSAMYHIAQNDPPCLRIIPENSEMPSWSDSFHSFVEQCLRKDPQQRLSTNACLAHTFVASERHPKVILELIDRIKNAVKEQDQSQYGKLRKLVMEESQTNGQNSETGSVEAQQQENMSIISEDEAQKSHQDQLNNRTVISVNGADSFHSSNGQPPTALSLHSATVLDQQQIKEEVNTLRRSKFSTLRTTKIIAKEMQEYQAENNFYEQMCGYKRLRQQHHKELKQLEERCRIETENNRLKQDREYEQLYQNCQKELVRVKSHLQVELERKVRDNEEELRKVGKNREAGLKHDIKSYASCQKKEYKFNKERCKMELKEQGMTRSAYESALKTTKLKLNEIRQQSEQKYADEQNAALKTELKEIQRQQLLRYHSLENQLSNNELNIRARQIETLHSLLLKHHELTKTQEFAQFGAMEQMKRRHLDIQHESELTSQRDYNRRALEEKTKEHGLQSKQQPRELKAKEAIIRKQFRQAVKIQTRQFKAYQAHMLQLAPREEHKELLNRLKEEQSRKIAALADQYEASIEQMVAEQNFKLDSQQEEDLKQLTEKLNKELSLLTDYQERQKADLNTQIEREKVQLQDRINLRLAILKQKINEEKTHFERQREKQLGQLHEKQAAQLDSFKANSRSVSIGSGNNHQQKSDESRQGTPRQSSSNSTLSQAGNNSAGRERKIISNQQQQIQEDLQGSTFSSNL